MAVINETVNYTELSNFTLNAVVVSGTPSEPITATLTFPSTGVGSAVDVVTKTYGSSTSVFTNHVWKITGTKTDVDAALADINIAPGNISDDFTITAVFTDSVGATVDSGDYNCVGSVLAANPVISAIADVNVGDLVTTDRPVANIVIEFTGSQDVYKATIDFPNTFEGSILTLKSGNLQTDWDATEKKLTAYGLKSEVQAALANLQVLMNDTLTQEWQGTVTISGANTSASTTINIVVNDELVSATNLTYAADVSEGTTYNIPNIEITDKNQLSQTFTGKFVSSNPAACSFSVGTYGTATSTWNNTFGVWEITGTFDEVNAAFADVNMFVKDSFVSNFTVTPSVYDGFTTTSGTWTFTNIDAAPTATNLNQNISGKESLVTDINNIVITDTDTSSDITATLTLSVPAAGSLTTGTYGTDSSTYNAGTGVWTINGDLDNVNAALADVDLLIAEGYITDFTIATSVTDNMFAPITGTINVTETSIQGTATNLTYAADVQESLTYNMPNIVISNGLEHTTATLTLSNTSAGSLSTGTYGTVTSTFGSGVWTASGLRDDVNTALASTQLTVNPGFTSDFTIAVNINDGTFTPLTGTWTFTETSVAPTATNLDAAFDCPEETNTATPDIVITDPDGHNTFTATLTLADLTSTPDLTVGSITTGTFGSTTSTWSNPTWTAIGTLTDVNAALAAAELYVNNGYGTDFRVLTSVDDGVHIALENFWAVNLVAPTHSATNLSQSLNFTNGSTVNPSDIVVSNTDGGDTDPYTITLTLTDPSAGVLTTSTNSTYNAGTGVWTTTGDLATVNAETAAVTFVANAGYDSNTSITTKIEHGIWPDLTGTWTLTFNYVEGWLLSYYGRVYKTTNIQTTAFSTHVSFPLVTAANERDHYCAMGYVNGYYVVSTPDDVYYNTDVTGTFTKLNYVTNLSGTGLTSNTAQDRAYHGFVIYDSEKDLTFIGNAHDVWSTSDVTNTGAWSQSYSWSGGTYGYLMSDAAHGIIGSGNSFKATVLCGRDTNTNLPALRGTKAGLSTFNDITPDTMPTNTTEINFVYTDASGTWVLLVNDTVDNKAYYMVNTTDVFNTSAWSTYLIDTNTMVLAENILYYNGQWTISGTGTVDTLKTGVIFTSNLSSNSWTDSTDSVYWPFTDEMIYDRYNNLYVAHAWNGSPILKKSTDGDIWTSLSTAPSGVNIDKIITNGQKYNT